MSVAISVDRVFLNAATCLTIAAAIPTLLIAILFERVSKMKRPFLKPDTRTEQMILSILKTIGVLAVAVIAIGAEGVAMGAGDYGLRGAAGLSEVSAFLFLFAFVILRWVFSTRGFEDMGTLIRESRRYRAKAERLVASPRTPEILKRSLRLDLAETAAVNAPTD